MRSRWTTAVFPLLLLACSPAADLVPPDDPPSAPAGRCPVEEPGAGAASTDPSRRDATGLRHFAFELVGGPQEAELAIVVDYVEEPGGLVLRTPPLLEGQSFSTDGRYTVESMRPTVETWGDPRSGVAAAVLVREAVVVDHRSGARLSLRSDGHRCSSRTIE